MSGGPGYSLERMAIEVAVILAAIAILILVGAFFLGMAVAG